jgi:hypothetical protein
VNAVLRQDMSVIKILKVKKIDSFYWCLYEFK